MDSFITELRQEEDTRHLGAALAKHYKNMPALILLSGDLGAGKTTFAQAFINELVGTPQMVASPTYSYCNRYEAKLTIFHFDLYRIEHPGVIEELGLKEQLYDNSALRLVEWPESMPDLSHSAHAHIFLTTNTPRIARTVYFINP